MNDLIERLRALSRHEHSDYSIGDEAAAALEAAREDVARVDWLEQADFSSIGDGGKSGVQITVYPLDGDGEWYGGRTLREAIDAAREARNG